jgi:phage baseplate assembly protein W
MTDVPHFSLPFRFAGSSVAVNEQDSIEEVADACLAILLCPVGFRVELPSFGLEDPTFTSPAPDLDTVREALDQWEPRAAAAISEYPDLLDALIAHVEVDVQVRTEA